MVSSHMGPFTHILEENANHTFLLQCSQQFHLQLSAQNKTLPTYLKAQGLLITSSGQKIATPLSLAQSSPSKPPQKVQVSSSWYNSLRKKYISM